MLVAHARCPHSDRGRNAAQMAEAATLAVSAEDSTIAVVGAETTAVATTEATAVGSIEGVGETAAAATAVMVTATAGGMVIVVDTAATAAGMATATAAGMATATAAGMAIATAAGMATAVVGADVSFRPSGVAECAPYACRLFLAADARAPRPHAARAGPDDPLRRRRRSGRTARRPWRL